MHEIVIRDDGLVELFPRSRDDIVWLKTVWERELDDRCTDRLAKSMASGQNTVEVGSSARYCFERQIR